ncbi:hypothetical protein DEDE109153_03165 [Deinococcus deserti]
MRPSLAFACLVLLSPAPLAQAQQPQVLKWGTLTVQVSPRDDARNTEAVAVVRNGTRTVLKVTGWSLTAELQPLRPGGRPELVISDFSGGAHCCQTVYLFTQDTGPVRNLGILDGGNYGATFTDLNRDGLKEILFASDVLAYYDWSYAVSPSLNTVLGWDGVRLADRTRAYSYVPAQEGARNLTDLKAMLKQPQPDVPFLRARVGGYYGNMILAGRGLEAEQVLTREIFSRSAALKHWFAQHRSGLIDATYAQPEGRIRVMEGQLYPIPRDDE